MIPGDAKRLKYKYHIFKVAALGQLQVDDVPPPGAAEDKVYEAMGTDSFDDFAKRVLGLFSTLEK